jgi:hypothetical protein
MPKVYSLHSILLKSCADGAEFERFVKEAIGSGPQLSGMTLRLLKGDRGDRKDRYAVMFEFDSIERRNELFPEAGPAARQVSDEFREWMGAIAPVMAKWDEYATPIDTVYTDYAEA